jgi:hypothetical protein
MSARGVPPTGKNKAISPDGALPPPAGNTGPPDVPGSRPGSTARGSEAYGSGLAGLRFLLRGAWRRAGAETLQTPRADERESALQLHPLIRVSTPRERALQLRSLIHACLHHVSTPCPYATASIPRETSAARLPCMCRRGQQAGEITGEATFFRLFSGCRSTHRFSLRCTCGLRAGWCDVDPCKCHNQPCRQTAKLDARSDGDGRPCPCTALPAKPLRAHAVARLACLQLEGRVRGRQAACTLYRCDRDHALKTSRRCRGVTGPQSPQPWQRQLPRLACCGAATSKITASSSATPTERCLPDRHQQRIRRQWGRASRPRRSSRRSSASQRPHAVHTSMRARAADMRALLPRRRRHPVVLRAGAEVRAKRGLARILPWITLLRPLCRRSSPESGSRSGKQHNVIASPPRYRACWSRDMLQIVQPGRRSAGGSKSTGRAGRESCDSNSQLRAAPAEPGAATPPPGMDIYIWNLACRNTRGPPSSRPPGWAGLQGEAGGAGAAPGAAGAAAEQAPRCQNRLRPARRPPGGSE